jgi:predicted anti-sigma-YlaC factor YlaD
MGWFQKSSDATEHGYVEERLSAYLDSELSSQERMAVDHHLARCQDCRWNLKTMRQTVQWTRELPTVPVPRVFTIPAPAQAVRAPRPRRTFAPLLQGATALVALLLVFVVAGDVMLTGFSGSGARQLAAPMEQPAAKVEATKVVELVQETVAVEAEATMVVKEVEVTKEVQALPPSAVEKAVEMPTSAAAWPHAPQATPTAEQVPMLEQAIASTQTAAPAGMGGVEETAQAAIGGGPPATEAPEPSRVVAPPLATTRASITGAVEAMATLSPTLSLTMPHEVGVSVTFAVEVTPAMPMAIPTEASLLAATAMPAAGEVVAVTSTPLPTRAPPPAATVEPAPAMLPEVAPTALSAAVEPTAVAAVQRDNGLLGVQPEERAPGALREPLVGWLRIAELTLGLAFVLLATATIVVMIRRRRAG